MPLTRLVVLLGFVISASGCHLGPRNITPDRFNYTEAIAQSNHEQLLSNIVRLRYSESPVFLGIGSVLTQYVYSGRISVSGAASQETTAVPGWTVGGSATGAYIERPTITYTPLFGQDFAQQLLAPIDSQAIFALVQSGWSPEELLKLAIERINDVDGRLNSPVPSDAELERLLGRGRGPYLIAGALQRGGGDLTHLGIVVNGENSRRRANRPLRRQVESRFGRVSYRDSCHFFAPHSRTSD